MKCMRQTRCCCRPSTTATLRRRLSARLNDTTILKSFLANNPYIKGIDSWKKLDAADEAGKGPRVVAYKRAPEILELNIPQEFEQFPPQPRNMEFIINCHAKFAGVSIYYPLAIGFLDGV